MIELTREDVSQLDSEHSFVFTYLGLSDEETCYIDRLKINKPIYYNRFGDLQLLREEMPNFLREIGNDDEELIQLNHYDNRKNSVQRE